MARIPPVSKEAVATREQAAFDAFAAGRGGPPSVGPYSIIAHMPELAQRLESLRTYLRAEDSLSQKLQEHEHLRVAGTAARDRESLADLDNAARR